MLRFNTTLIAAAFALTASAGFCAAPHELVSYNNIDVPSIAYLGPNLDVPQTPTSPGKTKRVSWTSVRIMCTGSGTICKAKIAVQTTPETTLGIAQMNLTSGVITTEGPFTDKLEKNGYTMKVVGPGEIQFVFSE